MNTSLTVHVLFRFSKRTGKIDTTMTALGSGLLQIWALNNTPKTKGCLIVERDTGKVIFATQGTENMPQVKKGNLGSVEDFVMSLEDLQTITDDRFDQ